MKRMKFLNGIGAMFALAVVALATTFTSCQKEEFNVDIKPANAQANVSPIVLFVDLDGTTTDVTEEPTTTISPAPKDMVYTGTPDLAEKTETLKVSYTYTEKLTNEQVTVSSEVKVVIPALKAGQFATITPTIMLQAKGCEITYVEEPKSEENEEDGSGYVENATDFYWITSRTYTTKMGRLVGDDAVSYTSDATAEDKMYINSVASTFKNTYKEGEAVLTDIYVAAHSRTYVTVTYNVVNSTITFSKNITVDGTDGTGVKKEIGSIVYKEYQGTIAEAPETNQNKPIPGHSHAPAGHGHGHGNDSNAGGGIVVAD